MTWLIVAIVIVLLVLAAFLLLRRRRQQQRTGELRERFGPEYERTIEREGDRGDAEQKLERRAEKRDRLEIRELEPGRRERFSTRWDDAQHLFVDDPSAAIGQADTLVHEVMGERGYPTDDFEDRADVISVDHPDLVEHYRGAHGVAQRAAREPISTEDQRQAMVHFRGLFDELLGSGRGGDGRRSESVRDERSAESGSAGAVSTDRERDPERRGDEPRGSEQLPR